MSGKEDANTFARGFYTVGKEVASLALDRIRWLSDSCVNLKGFMVYMSASGGTGSGLGSLVLDLLRSEFPKKENVVFQIFPSPILSKSFVDPYNTIFSVQNILQDPEPVSIVLDNDAIYDMCQNYLGVETPRH